MLTGRRIGFFLLFLLVVGLLAYGFWPRPLPVETFEVRRAPLRVTVEEEGRTNLRDHYVIHAPVSGYARRITLEAGDALSRGETIVVIDPLPSSVLDPRSEAQGEANLAAARARLGAQEAALAAARAEAELAADEIERMQRLFEGDAVSQQQLDQARTQHTRAQAALRAARQRVAAAQSEVRAAESVLAFAGEGRQGTGVSVPVTSPVEGRVLRVERQSAGAVQTGTPLVVVGDVRGLEVAVDVLSDDAVRIEPGMPVELDGWGGDRLLMGRVRQVQPSGFTKVSALGVEEQRVWVMVDITSDPALWPNLGDGYRVLARFLLWEGDDVLQIPRSAVFEHDGQPTVYVYADGRASLRSIETGRRSGLRVQVTDGLREGEAVLARPDERIEAGSRVEPREEGVS